MSGGIALRWPYVGIGIEDADCCVEVNVRDCEPPVAYCPDNIGTCNDRGFCSAVLGYEAFVSDNCTGASVD